MTMVGATCTSRLAFNRMVINRMVFNNKKNTCCGEGLVTLHCAERSEAKLKSRVGVGKREELCS